MMASAAITVSFTTSVVRSICSAKRNLGSGTLIYSILSAGYTESNGCDPTAPRRLCDNVQAPLQEAHHGELSGAEVPDVPEVPRQAGAHARRERAREVRGLRAGF